MEINSLAGFFSVITGFVFSGGGKEGGGREEEEREEEPSHTLQDSVQFVGRCSEVRS